MRIVRAKDYDDMSRKAAMIMAAQIAEKPDSILGLDTGSTPIGLYKCLIKWYEEGALDFSAIRTWNLDEYEGLPRTNDQSYYYFMHENLFDHVNLPEGATHVLNGMNPDAEAECAAYDKAIEEAGGIDIQLLGLGHDGHIAFNEPQDLTVISSTVYRLSNESLNRSPDCRYTVSIPSLLHITGPFIFSSIDSPNLYVKTRHLLIFTIASDTSKTAKTPSHPDSLAVLS